MSGLTLQQTYDQLISEKALFPYLSSLVTINSYQNLLQKLQTTSEVAVSDLLLFIVAYGNWTLSNSMVQFYSELETLKSRGSVGGKEWLLTLALAFQNGDMLVVNSLKELVYETENIDKQIILSASAEERENGIILKVRRKSSDVLSSSELEAFKSYISQTKIWGTKINVISQPADELNVTAAISYNSQLILVDVESLVNTAIEDYLDNLDFGGNFIKAQLIENVMAIPGILDFNISVLESRAYGGTYAAITNYVSEAGYLKLDTATLTYTAVK
jgi:hypothetical protein